MGYTLFCVRSDREAGGIDISVNENMFLGVEKMNSCTLIIGRKN